MKISQIILYVCLLSYYSLSNNLFGVSQTSYIKVKDTSLLRFSLIESHFSDSHDILLFANELLTDPIHYAQFNYSDYDSLKFEGLDISLLIPFINIYDTVFAIINQLPIKVTDERKMYQNDYIDTDIMIIWLSESSPPNEINNIILISTLSITHDLFGSNYINTMSSFYINILGRSLPYDSKHIGTLIIEGGMNESRKFSYRKISPFWRYYNKHEY